MGKCGVIVENGCDPTDAQRQTRNYNWTQAEAGSTRAELPMGHPVPPDPGAQARRRATSAATENSSSSLEMNPFLRVWSRVGEAHGGVQDVSQLFGLLMQGDGLPHPLVQP